MEIELTGRFATAVMLDIARHQRNGWSSRSDIAKRQGIPLSYAEQILKRMLGAGLITSMRGPGGGYMTTRDPEQITIAEVIAADQRPRMRGRDGLAAEHSWAVTDAIWAEAGMHLDAFFRRTTLQHLLKRMPPVAESGALRRPPSPAAESRPSPKTSAPNSVFDLARNPVPAERV